MAADPLMYLISGTTGQLSAFNPQAHATTVLGTAPGFGTNAAGYDEVTGTIWALRTDANALVQYSTSGAVLGQFALPPSIMGGWRCCGRFWAGWPAACAEWHSDAGDRCPQPDPDQHTGAGSDRFIFNMGDGSDTIAAIDSASRPSHDVIEFHGIVDAGGAAVNSFAALMAHLTAGAGTAVFDFAGGNRVVLETVDTATLTTDDFLFS